MLYLSLSHTHTKQQRTSRSLGSRHECLALFPTLDKKKKAIWFLFSNLFCTAGWSGLILIQLDQLLAIKLFHFLKGLKGHRHCERGGIIGPRHGKRQQGVRMTNNAPPSTGPGPEKIVERVLQGTEQVKRNLLFPRGKLCLEH